MAANASPINRHIGARLQMLRMKLGLTQTDIGELLDVTYQQAQKYESGAVRLSAESLFVLSQRLRVGIGYFFEGLEDRGGQRGFAENGTGDYAELPPKNGDAERLDRAFSRIRSKVARGHAIALVELVAKNFSDDRKD